MAIAAALWIDLCLIPEALLDSPLHVKQRQRLSADLVSGCAALERAAEELTAHNEQVDARLALVLTQFGQAAQRSSAEDLESLRERGYVARSRARRVASLMESIPFPAKETELRWHLYRLGELWQEAICFASGLAASSGGSEPAGTNLARAVALATDLPEEIFDPVPLVTGRDLSEDLGLAPGPEMGGILAAVRRRQIEGSIATRAEALSLAALLVGK